MARVTTIKLLRTTQATLDTTKAASGLIIGEPYFITDRKQLAIGTAVNNYSLIAPQFPMVDGTANTLSLNFDTNRSYFVTLNDTSVTFPTTNTTIPEGVACTILLWASGAARTFMIPSGVPNGQFHVTASPKTVEIPEAGFAEVSIMRYGSTYYYQVVNGMVGS
jgi:hypothetical protein